TNKVQSRHKLRIFTAWALMKLVRFPAPPPGLPHDELGDLRFPVPAFTDIQTNEPLAIHRTYLDRSTDNRLERKVLGLGICRLYSELHPVMRLCPDAEIADRLSVGEGIENGLVGILL